MKRNENVRHGSRVEKTHTKPSMMPSRSAILRAASSLRSLEPRYSNGRPCLRAMAIACALTRSALARRNGLTLLLSISCALSNCAVSGQPSHIA